MKILVLGSGLMGPAAAYIGLIDPEVAEVGLADMNAEQLELARAKLAAITDTKRLRVVQVDLADEATAAEVMAGYDVVVAALPTWVVHLGLRAAAKAHTPWVDLSWVLEEHRADIQAELEASGTLAIMGCGVEPGLTEIMARYVAEKLDQVHELHIKCGGIPVEATPPLGYKIVFGGRRLPLRDTDAHVVEDGTLRKVARYSGVERVHFAGVGECEAWHEGFMPWLMDLEALKGLQVGTQKTVRWPGYAAKATTLRELGLLSQSLVRVNGTDLKPKDVVDEVLYSRVRMEEQDRDITTFRVEASGTRHGRPRSYCVDMVDRYDEALGFTSMARVTAFTGAIVARMVARGDISGKGLATPEQLVAGAHLKRLVRELADQGIRFELTKTSNKILGD
jgi:saccharopine dehydrogenase-like NADP-dependent oxidoreductase